MKKVAPLLGVGLLLACFGSAVAQQSGGGGGGGGSSGLTISTTTITGGATGQILYDNSDVLGEIAKANSGVLVTNGSGVPSISTTLPSGILATNMTLTTPALGVAAGTSLVLGGATIGANTLALTGGSLLNGEVIIQNAAADGILLESGTSSSAGVQIYMTSADGVLALSNAGGNNFTKLILGTLSSGSPSINKNGAAINFRLADDSNDAAITAGAVTSSGHFIATGLVSAASCSGQPSGEIISTTGTGALVQCP